MEELKVRVLATFDTQIEMLDAAEKIAANVFQEPVEDCLYIPYSPSKYTGKFNLLSKRKLTYIEGRKLNAKVNYYLNSIGA